MSLKKHFVRFGQTSIGIIFSQLLTISFIPILSRNYEPSSFGQFGFFLSVTILLSGCASWKLQDSISTCKSSSTSRSLTKISLATGLLTVLVASPFVLLGTIVLFSSVELGALTVISSLGIVIANIGIQNLIRQKKFTSYSLSIFFLTGLVPLAQIFFHEWNLNGLVLGAVLSHTIAGLYTLTLTRNYIFPIKFKFSRRELACFRVFKSYFYFALPNFFLSNFRVRILYFVFPTYASNTFLGTYAQADRLLGAPTNLLATALRPIATSSLLNKKNQPVLLLEKYLKTQWYSLPPIVALVMIYSQELVEIIFGPGWQGAAIQIKILSIPAFFMATTQWLDRFYDFTRTHHIVLRLEALFNALSIAVIATTLLILDDSIQTLFSYSIIMTIYYIWWTHSLFKALNGSPKPVYKILPISFLIFTLTSIPIYLLDNFILASGLSLIFSGIIGSLVIRRLHRVEMAFSKNTNSDYRSN